ncbi:hypothetical protein L249_8018 [Ophiocordyceps polyrhachis-furcata BCC 54312]|uniref:Uncharacterized protein n=1 Tax=Ophiocordyceps polyrhachis-furcata BCC 54312 TaxID=1330021 RepID=A0A367LI14_9HYPO|nr:hypothetical protein L249_8018 [Ophiocordyceps polyrhachis-furcata BCC 54312]
MILFGRRFCDYRSSPDLVTMSDDDEGKQTESRNTVCIIGRHLLSRKRREERRPNETLSPWRSMGWPFSHFRCVVP